MFTRTRISVAEIPRKYIPLPKHSPIPTVAQRPAAVVSPMMLSLRTKMTPAPRKPMDWITPAAILPPSDVSLTSGMLAMSRNPYFETIIRIAAEMATITWVLRPAFLYLRSLSRPMTAPQTADRIILNPKSRKSTIVKYLNIGARSKCIKKPLLLFNGHQYDCDGW